MVAKAGGYFGRPFKGCRGVIQGDPLYSTIFNVVMDAVIHHLVMVVTPSKVVMGVLVLTIINLEAYFYADGGIVELTQPERLQMSFDALTCLFERFGLRKNMEKMVGMVCQPCHAPGRVLEESYAQQMTRKGPTFWEHQRRRVECPD